ncbi:hypothetical protein [Microbulbifer sp. TYP-18]|uniref:hypothetical protein n=1 Tax=Microbulbifer sp. TYP-18 TaxID=3230024 RepID=UPI0034C65D2B
MKLVRGLISLYRNQPPASNGRNTSDHTKKVPKSYSDLNGIYLIQAQESDRRAAGVSSFLTPILFFSSVDIFHFHHKKK